MPRPYVNADSAGRSRPSQLPGRPRQMKDGFRFDVRALIRLRLPEPVKWVGTLLLVLLAYTLRVQVFTALPPLPLLFFLPAILFSAMFFGRGHGFFATLLSTAVAAYFFLPPVGSVAIANPNAALSLALFVLTGTVITLMGSALRQAYLDAELLHQEKAIAYQEAEKARAAAEQGERERELLLVEFGHRVKNDMQRTIATFNLQAAHSTPEVAAALRQAANQVNVIASMHDRLAHNAGEVSVDVAQFLRDLASGLQSSLAETRPIGIFVEAPAQMVSIDQAGAVGLIANELITNALKHAFPEDRAGRIDIGFRRVDEQFILTVTDNGVGFPGAPANGTMSGRAGLGRKLTRALAAQLGGDLTSAPGQPAGTATELRFPVADLGTAQAG